MANTEPNIIKEFRELYDYVRLTGEHINQIYTRLEQIEKKIDEVSVSHSTSIMENKNEILNVKDNMVNKFELNNFVETLKASVGEILPPLPTIANERTLTGTSSHPTDEV